jgi:hypothetical protein
MPSNRTVGPIEIGINQHLLEQMFDYSDLIG